MKKTQRKILLVVGTRPEAIKMAPLLLELRARPGVEASLVSTGQHREMLNQALEVFGVRPDFDLGVMTPNQTLEDVTCRTLQSMRSMLRELSPDFVVVQGDTTTALAAALAAFYQQIPVAHVEAGLRSHQRYAPFPEEVNRRLVDQISELMFAPTEDARRTLLGEGMHERAVHMSGNTVVDALLMTRERLRTRPVELGLPARFLDNKRLVLVTAHRRESFGGGIESICRALLRIVRANRDVCAAYPVHLNPNVDGVVRRLLSSEDRIALLPPLGYLPFTALLDRAHLVLTDSGGVQEEAPTFGKPLLVLRDVTERPEGVAAGVAKLIGTSEQRLVDETQSLLDSPREYARMAQAGNPYGDGQASRRIADVLLQARA